MDPFNFIPSPLRLIFPSASLFPCMGGGGGSAPKAPPPPAQRPPPPAPSDAVTPAKTQMQKNRPKFGRQQTILSPSQTLLSTILGTPIS